MSIDTNFRVAVLNRSGNTGKTTIARVLLKMRMPDAELISIETTNTDGQEDENGSLVKAQQFHKVYEALAFSKSLILDVGSSNIIEILQEMEERYGTADNIDYFLVPVVSDEKQRRDSIRTVHDLLKLGVEPSKIKVVFNRVGLTEEVTEVFDDMIYALENLGVDYDLDVVIRKSNFFKVFERTKMSLADFKEKIMAVPFEVNQKRQEELRMMDERTKEQDEEFREVVQTLAIQSLAISATKNLDRVFETLFKERLIKAKPKKEAAS